MLKDQKTPLHVAAIRNSTTAAQTLVELKADVTIKDKVGARWFNITVPGSQYHT